MPCRCIISPRARVAFFIGIDNADTVLLDQRPALAPVGGGRVFIGVAREAARAKCAAVLAAMNAAALVITIRANAMNNNVMTLDHCHRPIQRRTFQLCRLHLDHVHSLRSFAPGASGSGIQWVTGPFDASSNEYPSSPYHSFSKWQ